MSRNVGILTGNVGKVGKCREGVGKCREVVGKCREVKIHLKNSEITFFSSCLVTRREGKRSSIVSSIKRASRSMLNAF